MHRATVGSGGGAVSYERGTPVLAAVEECGMGSQRQDQNLALTSAFSRRKLLKTFRLFPSRSEAVVTTRAKSPECDLMGTGVPHL